MASSPDSPPAGKAAATGCAGCLSGSLGLAAAAVVGLLSLTFLARDVVSTFFPLPARAVGLGWFAAQPRPAVAVATGPAWTCTLDFRQRGPTWVRYWLTCDATADIELSELKLTSMPRGSSDPLADSYEEQWPMSRDTIPIERGRSFAYTGTMAIESTDAIPGMDVPDKVIWTAKITWKGGEERIRLVAEEP